MGMIAECYRCGAEPCGMVTTNGRVCRPCFEIFLEERNPRKNLKCALCGGDWAVCFARDHHPLKPEPSLWSRAMKYLAQLLMWVLNVGQPQERGFVRGKKMKGPRGCSLPPDEFYCTRDAGHDGPCATRRVMPPIGGSGTAPPRTPHPLGGIGGSGTAPSTTPKPRAGYVTGGKSYPFEGSE